MDFSPSKLELLSSVLPAGNLQWFLLIGSGVLAVSLLVLAMTKWGHSRPVWKCVILSFVAHILLLAYAWGTWLILEAAGGGGARGDTASCEFDRRIW